MLHYKFILASAQQSSVKKKLNTFQGYTKGFFKKKPLKCTSVAHV